MSRRTLYQVWYVDTKGNAFEGRCYSNAVNARAYAKRGIGKLPSIHDDAVIARATVYRNDVPFAIYGDGRVQPVN